MTSLFETLTLVAVSVLIVLAVALYVAWTNTHGPDEKNHERND